LAAAADVPPGGSGDFYGVLGLEPRASREQVERAYRFHLELYREGSLATYTLLDPSEAEQQRSRLREAYEVLADDERRRAYDEGRGFPPPDTPVLPSPEPGCHHAPPPELSPVRNGADPRQVREARGISVRGAAKAARIGVRFLEDLFVSLLVLPAVVGLLIWRRLRNPGLRGGRGGSEHIASRSRLELPGPGD
jgi:hypothetical protein